MKKEFNRNDIAAIKRAAASITPLIAKRDKILMQKMTLQLKLDELQSRINLFNVPIKEMTGYNTEELVERKDGTYILKYPETVIPEQIQIEDTLECAVIDIDDTEKVEEVESAPTDLPFNTPY